MGCIGSKEHDVTNPTPEQKKLEAQAPAPATPTGQLETTTPQPSEATNLTMVARVVVAGASGNVGSAAVHKLSQMGVEVKALTRSSAGEKCAPLKALEHVQLVECDISDQSSLSGVFEGVKAAFLTCGNFQGQVAAEKAFIDAAVAAGCPYLVKLGSVRCYTSMDSAIEYARFHAEIEAHLEKVAGAMKYTVLCPNWFFSNHLADVFGTLPMGIIAYPLSGEAKAAPVDPRDVGELAAQMMMTSDPSAYHGLKLDVSGPEAVSMAQVAALYTAALGTPRMSDARRRRSGWGPHRLRPSRTLRRPYPPTSRRPLRAPSETHHRPGTAQPSGHTPVWHLCCHLYCHRVSSM
jgi:NAD(P)H dehydrogenase (quinone)